MTDRINQEDEAIFRRLREDLSDITEELNKEMETLQIINQRIKDLLVQRGKIEASMSFYLPKKVYLKLKSVSLDSTYSLAYTCPHCATKKTCIFFGNLKNLKSGEPWESYCFACHNSYLLEACVEE